MRSARRIDRANALGAAVLSLLGLDASTLTVIVQDRRGEAVAGPAAAVVLDWPDLSAGDLASGGSLVVRDGKRREAAGRELEMLFTDSTSNPAAHVADVVVVVDADEVPAPEVLVARITAWLRDRPAAPPDGSAAS